MHSLSSKHLSCRTPQRASTLVCAAIVALVTSLATAAPALAATCGNGIVTAGEECDDGNTVDGDGCSATCRRQEVCTDLVDNDGDGLVDCDDPDCPDCRQIFKDPATITFNETKLDVFKVHGGVEPITDADPRTELFGILITNANGIVYQGMLLPGDIKGSDRKLSFVDRGAKKGLGTRDGIYKLMLRRVGGRYHFNLEAYGDLSAATQPVMTAQLLLGDEVFAFKSEWKQLKHGWKTDFKFPFDN